MVEFVLQALIPPALAIFPFLKVVPFLYAYRSQQLLKRHYAALRELEVALDAASDPAQLYRKLADLDNLHHVLQGMSRKVPAHLQGEIYHWRLHIALVRSEAQNRLVRLRDNQGVARDPWPAGFDTPALREFPIPFPCI